MRGSTCLKTHKLKGETYFPDGSLELDSIREEKFIKSLFSREEKRGLSVAIPFIIPELKKDIEEIKEEFVAQFYYPIIKEKLEINFQEDNKKELKELKLNSENIQESQNHQIDLLKKERIEVTELISEPNNLKLENEEKIVSALKEEKAVQIAFVIPIEKANSREKGYLWILMGRKEEEENKQIDFWRGDLLISKAGGRMNASRHSMMVIINSENELGNSENELGILLRELENPGHTNWETGSLPEKVKEDYKSATKIRSLVKRIPKKLLQIIKNQDIELDSNFFNDYFPFSGANKSSEGQSEGGSDGKKKVIIIPSIPSIFTYRENRKENGFIVRLNKEKITEEKMPKEIHIEVAYGANNEKEFKYDSKDFDFRDKQNKNYITIIANKGKMKEKEGNKVSYEINEPEFNISLSGFDPKRELKIKIQE